MQAILERPTLTIRRATLEDLPVLITLEQTFPGDRLERANFRYFLTRSKADIWIAEHNGKVLGDAVVVYRQGFHSARLYSLVVSPEARGKGIGAALLAHAEDKARERGCITLRLEVREDNPAAIRLYTTRGYDLLGRTDDYYEDGSTALRMRKRLFKTPAVLLKVPYYEQSLDFTCGPACLMMAMRYLGSKTRMTQSLETQLWREATTIFMMSGHGGCSAEGLAVAALRRNFKVTIYTRDKQIPFIDSVRSKEKKQVMHLSHEQFLDDIKKHGGKIKHRNFDHNDVTNILREGGLPIILISSMRFYNKKVPHWAVVSGFDDEHLYLHDPWIPKGLEKADGLHLPLKREDFARVSQFGKARHRYMVVLYKSEVV